MIAGIAGGAAFKEYSNLAGALALLSTALITMLTFLKPSERAQTHKAFGGQYLSLRNKTRLFREIELLNEADAEFLRKQLYEFSEQRNDVNQSAPKIITRDYERAKKEIEAGFAIHEVDKGES